MSGAIRLLLLYAFMALTGTSLPLRAQKYTYDVSVSYGLCIQMRITEWRLLLGAFCIMKVVHSTV
jgi:hypothetical protein